ncbi:adenosylcobinamide-GDP ribazoletransferase [Psychrobacter celer]
MLLVAVQFLTRLPVPAFKTYDPQWLHQSSRHFPAVGLLAGLLCAGQFVVYALGRGGDKYGLWDKADWRLSRRRPCR